MRKAERRYLISIITIIAFIALCMVSCAKVESTDANSSITSEVVSHGANDEMNTCDELAQSGENDSCDGLAQNDEEKAILEVHFIDVGQGDAILLKCDGHNLLIDAGDNDKGTTVQLYLKKQKVDNLDAVIWTHPDADHIGGADVITTKYNIGTIYMPEVEATTKTYSELIDAINYRHYSVTVPSPGDSFNLGPAKVTFLGPLYVYSDNNNNSLVCMVEYGRKRFLLTGDAEEAAEKALVNRYGDELKADVYKAGHHGSKSSSSVTFLNCVNPEYVVISCAEGNRYGHPHAETLNNLRRLGYNVYRTDEQGSIVVTTDGDNMNWNAAPSITWLSGDNGSQ